ncbi:MAG: isoprenylcysteine carboxylmethyltransferase family protein [Gemmatimonadales bacterium]|jgi:protein-S-isoprenylcysteine O-methyltransferase Ste14
MGITLLQILMVVWAVAETSLMIRTRARRGTARQGARGSAWIVWTVIAFSIGGALWAQASPAPRFPVQQAVCVWTGLAVMLSGMVVRLAAIRQLGRYFSVDVAIQREHRVIRSGLYAHLRHPSYTGMLLAFLGLGIALGNWLSLALAALPTTAVVLYRIGVEEQALAHEFGDEYQRYREQTSRLVPGIY